MNRIDFVKRCGAGCLSLIITPVLMNCSGPKYLTAPIEGSDMIVPLNAFEIIKENGTTYRNYVIVENDTLQFPICIYRMDAQTYHALWMKCTHQGTELHVFGDKLQCPAHGSEFTNTGAVQNGPAADPLRTFQIVPTETSLKVSLR